MTDKDIYEVFRQMNLAARLGVWEAVLERFHYLWARDKDRVRVLYEKQPWRCFGTQAYSRWYQHDVQERIQHEVEAQWQREQAQATRRAPGTGAVSF